VTSTSFSCLQRVLDTGKQQQRSCHSERFRWMIPVSDTLLLQQRTAGCVWYEWAFARALVSIVPIQLPHYHSHEYNLSATVLATTSLLLQQLQLLAIY